MDISMPYNGALTAEQFLFYEMRIVAKQYLEQNPIEEIIEHVKGDNLFQYPTTNITFKENPSAFQSLDIMGMYRMLQLKMQEFELVKQHFDRQILSKSSQKINTCVVKIPEKSSSLTMHLWLQIMIWLEIEVDTVAEYKDGVITLAGE